VIQGVALADLAVVAGVGYKQFTPVQWLLVVLNFATLIIVWDSYTQQSILWEWVPDIRDAAIPFALGALELILNHTIILSLSAWLVTFALISGLGGLANWHVIWRASKDAANTKMLSLLSRRSRLIIVLYGGWSVLLLMLAVVSLLGGLEASESIQGVRGVLALALVLLVIGGLVVFRLIVIRSWSQVVTYARTGQIQPGWQAEDLIK
jgi:hypothetical protein